MVEKKKDVEEEEEEEKKEEEKEEEKNKTLVGEAEEIARELNKSIEKIKKRMLEGIV